MGWEEVELSCSLIIPLFYRSITPSWIDLAREDLLISRMTSWFWHALTIQHAMCRECD